MSITTLNILYTRPHIVIDFIRFQAHHGPGEENESRFIDQPLLPENTVVSPDVQMCFCSMVMPDMSIIS